MALVGRLNLNDCRTRRDPSKFIEIAACTGKSLLRKPRFNTRPTPGRASSKAFEKQESILEPAISQTISAGRQPAAWPARAFCRAGLRLPRDLPTASGFPRGQGPPEIDAPSRLSHRPRWTGERGSLERPSKMVPQPARSSKTGNARRHYRRYSFGLRFNDRSLSARLRARGSRLSHSRPAPQAFADLER